MAQSTKEGMAASNSAALTKSIGVLKPDFIFAVDCGADLCLMILHTAVALTVTPPTRPHPHRVGFGVDLGLAKRVQYLWPFATVAIYIVQRGRRPNAHRERTSSLDFAKLG